MRAPLGQAEAVARVIRIVLPAVALVPFASFTVAMAMAVGDPANRLLAGALWSGIAAVFGGTLTYWQVRRSRMTAAMDDVARVLTGTSARDDVRVVADWLDRHWPWPTTGLLLPGNVGARRWCVQGSFEGRAVLVSAFRRMQVRSQPALHRIDVFVSAPAGRSPRAELVAALEAHANPLGFTVAALDHGVHLARYDSDPRSLGHEQLTPLLRAACGALA